MYFDSFDKYNKAFNLVCKSICDVVLESISAIYEDSDVELSDKEIELFKKIGVYYAVYVLFSKLGK